MAKNVARHTRLDPSGSSSRLDYIYYSSLLFLKLLSCKQQSYGDFSDNDLLEATFSIKTSEALALQHRIKNAQKNNWKWKYEPEKTPKKWIENFSQYTSENLNKIQWNTNSNILCAAIFKCIKLGS